MPKVILKFEAAVLKEFALGAVLTVGRDADNDVVIDHPAVSRHHCRIVQQGGTYFVEDLNSTNGSLLNGKKIIKAGVHDQDEIVVAKHSLIVLDVGAAPAANPNASISGFPSPTSAPLSAAKGDKINPDATASHRFDPLGGVRVIEGVVDQVEFVLTENSTYIGKSDRVTIKIKGGMFAPEVAAMISRRPQGYFLVAIKEGYPKVNGLAVSGERMLNEGDQIEIGGTLLQFYLKTGV